MQLDWNALLSDKRVSVGSKSAKPVGSADDDRSPFEADYDRVVYSDPFRRMARKTQVHPFAPNDHIHTRLTHSIEVASVGRTFASRLGKFLKSKGEQDRTLDLCQIVQAACLAHDIGNPPFGHAGEFAIREWVKLNGDHLFPAAADKLDPGVRADWELFEGNAQGFRLAARADNSRTGYMRLTYATLGAMIKYPWDSADERARAKGKLSVFSSEKGIFRAMSSEMGLAREDGNVVRHPLSFLSEAADDICYRILDVEDAVDMGIVTDERARGVFRDFLKSESKATDVLAVLRGKVMRKLITGCWQVFERDYDAIMAGTRHDDLKAGLDEISQKFLGTVKSLYSEIFAHRSKVATELGAYECVGRIIHSLAPATFKLSTAKNYAGGDFLTQRRLDLAWGRQYASANQGQSYEWWLHQTMDYIAGLTDNFARQLSREVAGL
jgi:dGTPase